MTFSVAMATYNGARYLEAQLDSIAGQTLPPAELVACDDGSTDGTRDILARFARRAPFEVRFEQNPERLGASDNFLRAASLCRSEWIAFCDQDDVWLPGKLAAVEAVVRARPEAQMVAHRATLVDEGLRPLGGLLHVPPVRRRTIIGRLARSFWQYPYGFTISFRARLLGAVPIAGRPIESHDRWIAVLASVLGETVYLPEPLALYRRHAANVSALHDAIPAIESVRQPGMEQEFSGAAETVRALAEHLERSAAPARIEEAVRLREAAQVFRRQAGAYTQRAALCREGQALRTRLVQYAALWARGGYATNRRGGLGVRAGVKDALRFVLRPERRQR